MKRAGPAFQLSNASVPCAGPLVGSPVPGRGWCQTLGLSLRSASWLGWVEAPFLKKGGAGPERVVLRHLIRGGGGLVLYGVEARKGQGGTNGFKTLFQICPAGGVVPFLGTDVPGTSPSH